MRFDFRGFSCASGGAWIEGVNTASLFEVERKRTTCGRAARSRSTPSLPFTIASGHQPSTTVAVRKALLAGRYRLEFNHGLSSSLCNSARPAASSCPMKETAYKTDRGLLPTEACSQKYSPGFRGWQMRQQLLPCGHNNFEDTACPLRLWSRACHYIRVLYRRNSHCDVYNGQRLNRMQTPSMS
ncbi:hypothetical protein CYLTODRAFT_231472 [Cylindrobasidium torrendii FP15055 ss-10]|uniref:Uncharacterized protein n=1 Tax=Cylindrobasidium torrendii FP15055 ss-10 TaxID=1314674 RepID=A0A0D7ASW6_9AGAR|nr:hypothetical protein CYLTODRAFT_231472 [Cylindrobasidium torrendii FP15055 ss-10]